MSAVALTGNNVPSLWEVAETCKIVVLCENAAARDRAVEMFNRISNSIADDLTFAINCWNFQDLTEPESARCVSLAAAGADIILFSTRGSELPLAVSDWLDGFSVRDGKAEGALAFLVVDPGNPSAAVGNMILRLTQVADRLGMDFIPLMPSAVAEMVPTAKATGWTVRGTNKQIYEERSYSHWGLNE